MLGAVKKFCRKHRRLLLVAGVAAAGTAVAYQIVTENLAETERQAKCVAEKKRKRAHLDRARVEWKTGLCNFLPTLKKRLCSTVDVMGPVRELREVRQQVIGGSENVGRKETKESALWDEVKILTFTRLLTGVYGFVALDLMLGLQLHMLGRYGYEETGRLLHRLSASCSPRVEPYDILLQRLSSFFSSNQQQQHQDGVTSSNSEERMMVDSGAQQGEHSCNHTTTTHSSQHPDHHLNMEEEDRGAGLTGEAQQVLLSSTYEYALGEGLANISQDIRAVVERNMSNWHCQSKLEVGRDELYDLLINIRLEFEGPDKVRDTMSDAHHVILPHYLHDLLTCLLISMLQGMDLMMKYFINPVFAKESNKQVQLLLNETWDAVESPGFHVALQHALQSMFITLFRDMDKVVFGLESGVNLDNGCGELPHPPLASVITNIKIVLAEMMDPVVTNEYENAISRLSSVLDFYHSVFDASTPHVCKESITNGVM